MNADSPTEIITCSNCNSASVSTFCMECEQMETGLINGWKTFATGLFMQLLDDPDFAEECRAHARQAWDASANDKPRADAARMELESLLAWEFRDNERPMKGFARELFDRELRLMDWDAITDCVLAMYVLAYHPITPNGLKVRAEL